MSDRAPGTIDWPNVPACHGWLSLDRRGHWKLKGEAITHRGLVNFINLHYAADAGGNWFFQNGPQKVFVALAYTPLVVRLMPDGSLIGHTGMSPGPALRAFIDEEGNALLETPSGIGLLDDRDLHAFVGACRDVHDEIPSDKALLDAMAGGGGVLWQGLALESIKSCDVPGRFGFKPDPGP